MTRAAQNIRVFVSRPFPSSTRRGGCDIKKKVAKPPNWSRRGGRAGRTLPAFSTTPSAPANEASRHFVYVAATPPRGGGEWPAQKLVVSPINGPKPTSVLRNTRQLICILDRFTVGAVYDRRFYSAGLEAGTIK